MAIDADELAALRDLLREFLATHSSEETVRKTIETGAHDPALWSRLTSELGIGRLATPERFGGEGLGFPELRVVLEEQGRALACSPYLASIVLAQQLLLATGDEAACARYLPDIASGASIATVAIAEGSGEWELDRFATTATQTLHGWRLSGTKQFVIDGAAANLLLVLAQTADGASLFAVQGSAPELVRSPLPVLDGTRPLTTIEFDGCPAELVGAEGSAAPAIEHLLDVGGLAVAAELVGAGRHCLAKAVEYAKQREQFGRPIGAFQAIKHKLAQMLAEVELADALTEGAAILVAADSPEAPAACTAAYLRATAALQYVTSETIQVFGGTGFTWEHFAHLYFRRAAAASNLFGRPGSAQERLLRRLGV